MSAETIVAALLNTPGVTTVVGNRRALTQLPQNAPLPALIYQVVSTNPDRTVGLNAAAGSQLLMSRVQVTGLAADPGSVQTILAAAVIALNFKSGMYAGQKVALIVRDLATALLHDSEAGLWYASQDFLMNWWE